MAKKRTHPNKTPLHSFESCEFWDKILADISGPFQTDSLGNRYCLMVIESLSMYVILIPLKSVSAEAVASALYTRVFTKHGVCNTILLTDRGSAFRSALVKAVADIFMVKQVFGMTARPSTLSQIEIINKLLCNYLQAVCKKQDDWSSHLATIELGHNHFSITGSRYFSPYFCLTGRNLVMPIDPKTLKSKHSGHTDVDEHVRSLLPKLDHGRELARRNVIDFHQNYKSRMIGSTRLNQLNYELEIMFIFNRNALR